MTENNTEPLAKNPCSVDPLGLGLVLAGTYERQLGASLARVWENVYDWEHLPWLHDSTFKSIRLEANGDWGWRARASTTPQPDDGGLIELVTDKPNHRYVARTIDGPGKGSEIWTNLEVIDDHKTGVQVKFLVPPMEGVDPKDIGDVLGAVYQTLWDEDEAMMVARQQELDRGRLDPPTETLDIGTDLPQTIEWAGHKVRIVELKGDLVAYSLRCPHILGPLDEAEIKDGCVTCPWHGYKFDVRTRKQVGGQGLRLRPAFQVKWDEATGHIQLSTDGTSNL